MNEKIKAIRYSSTRYNIEADTDPQTLRTLYEQAVPPVPEDQVANLVRRRAPWPEMLDLIGSSAPHGFLIYHRNDAAPVFPLAGDTAVCTSYLMGNHTIAERMYRFDPSVLLYAPLHTAIWGEPQGPSYFTFDRPGDQFGSFGSAEIAAIGQELDAKLAALLDHLGLPTPLSLKGGQGLSR
ncbi:DUF302 domain-containing protein [Streptomyces sp. NPDC088253]|uniref:DUF302 domain-containing protein n=1 Tax=Streptomyces sp. NPDC088253 TaxID=3365846 RepID=UPI0038092B7F